jgi:phage terminase large subunit-like protein
MNYIREYWQRIASGEIVACRKIKVVYEYLVYCLDHDMGQWRFDEALANKPIDFVETFCLQSQGRNAGKPLKLELFQKARRQAIFGFVDKVTGFRQYTESMTVEGRKNGKTTENAADGMYMLVGDGEGSAEVYFVATKYDQAKKAFNECHKMASMNPSANVLSKYIRKTKTGLSYDSTFSIMQPLASKDLDSLNTHFACIDELAAIKKRELYDDMKQSTSFRDQALISSISTNGFVRECIFDTQYDYAASVIDYMEDFLLKAKEHGYDEIMRLIAENNITFKGRKDDNFLPLIYELDDRAEWDNEDCWIKANPGIDTIKKRHVLRGYVNKAKGDASFKATVMVKDFNMKESSVTRWLLWEQLYNDKMIGIEHGKKDFTYADMVAGFKSMGFDYAIGAIDFAETADLASARIYCMRPNDPQIYTLQMYWTPGDGIEDKSKNDGVSYTAWEARGLIRTCEGYKIRKEDVIAWFDEVKEELDIYTSFGGYDPWHVMEAEQKQLENTYGKNAFKPVRQGKYTLSTPMHEMKKDLEAKIIVYNNHPIDKWCLSNMEVQTDINNNIQPVKGQDLRKRIDGAVTMIIAYERLSAKKDEYLNMI